MIVQLQKDAEINSLDDLKQAIRGDWVSNFTVLRAYPQRHRLGDGPISDIQYRVRKENEKLCVEMPLLFVEDEQEQNTEQNSYLPMLEG